MGEYPTAQEVLQPLLLATPLPVHPEVVGAVGSAGLSPLYGPEGQRAGKFRLPLALREAKRRERRAPSSTNWGCTALPEALCLLPNMLFVLR
jgi:hypothetical protein